MQHVIVGVDENGCSRVEEIRLIDAEGRATERVTVMLWDTDLYPPEISAPIRSADQPCLDVGVHPSRTSWRLSRHAGPGMSAAGMHRTDTLDYVGVVQGSATLLLEKGEVDLVVGDTVVNPGLVHGWLIGPEGCTLLLTMLGYPIE